MDTYACEGLSKIFFVYIVLYCLRCCHDRPSKQEALFPDFITLFLKFIIKSLIHSRLVNFCLAVGCPSLAHSKNINFIGRECPNFREDGWKYRDIVGKCHFFPKAPLISLISFVGGNTLHDCCILHIKVD